MQVDMKLIDQYYSMLDDDSHEFLDLSIKRIVEAKKKGGKVVVATGSGPNIHEGVTTLIAELMNKGVIDGVTTSSAVIAHEMGGVLDKVKRIKAEVLGDLVDQNRMPRGDIFELTQMTDDQWNDLSDEMILDDKLVKTCKEADGEVIIKAAGNMAYPMGLACEVMSGEILNIARTYNVPFEEIAGLGSDERTMLGAGAKNNLPVLVSIPQLVGGGHVGISIGDSIPISQRCARVAEMLGDADVIIESAVALTQEIHDGPFETFTGHGIWSDWMGYRTYSIKGKTIIRFDLDDNLKKAWELDRDEGSVQRAIDEGLPKTKLTKIPFRMEMSAFSRLKTSIPVIGDIGVIWPILAAKVCEQLDIELDFISAPQETEQGKEIREEIAKDIKATSKNKILKAIKTYNRFNGKGE